jgi:hypothetical protein
MMIMTALTARTWSVIFAGLAAVLGVCAAVIEVSLDLHQLVGGRGGRGSWYFGHPRLEGARIAGASPGLPGGESGRMADDGEIERAAHGYEATRDDAMAAFAKSWRRE